MRASRPFPWLIGLISAIASVVPFFLLGDDGWMVGLVAFVPLGGLALCTAPWKSAPRAVGILLRIGVYLCLLAWLVFTGNTTGAVSPQLGTLHLAFSLGAVLLFCFAIVGRKPVGPEPFIETPSTG